MNKINRGILYLSLHNQLKKKFGIGRTITRKEFFCKLGKHSQVPKNLRYVVIKEMEEKKLIKIEDRDNISLLKCDIDLEKDINKLYELAGLYGKEM